MKRKQTICLNPYKADIIEIFEEFLEERGIDVPNPEKAEDDEACSIVYGSDFAELMDMLTDPLYRLASQAGASEILADAWAE